MEGSSSSSSKKRKAGRPSNSKDESIGAIFNVKSDVLYVSDIVSRTGADDAVPAVFKVATITKIVITETGATYTIKLLLNGEEIEDVDESELVKQVAV